MSSVPNSVTQVDRYREIANMTTSTFYIPDEPIVRKSERAQPSFLETIVGRHGGLRAILSQVEAVATTNATVLITGETGTANEAIPRAIHHLTPRPRRTLINFTSA